MTRPPRRFGRALRLSAKKRRMERLYDLIYTGGWPSWLARPLGLQGRLRLEHHHIAIHGTDAAAPPLRVGFISDLHGGPGTHPATIRRACELVADAKPDLLLLGGDFVSFHARHVESVLDAIEAIEAPLGRIAVLGNHDLIADDAWLVERLAGIGVRTLVNENVRLAAPYDRLSIVGLDNSEQGTPDGPRALAGADGIRLVLMHSPDGLTALGSAPFGMAFTGHVHGGQFVLPGGISLISSKGPLSQRYFWGGLFVLGPPGSWMPGAPDAPSGYAVGSSSSAGRRSSQSAAVRHPRESTACDATGDARSAPVLLVSRGIGQGSLPMRFRADPQVHVCELRFEGTTDRL